MRRPTVVRITTPNDNYVVPPTRETVALPTETARNPAQPQATTGQAGTETAGVVVVAPAVAAEMPHQLDDILELMTQAGLCSVAVIDGNGLLIGTISRNEILQLILDSDDVLTATVQEQLDDYIGAYRWHASVTDGHATLNGPLADEAEQRLAIELAHTAPGVRSADIQAPHGCSDQAEDSIQDLADALDASDTPGEPGVALASTRLPRCSMPINARTSSVYAGNSPNYVWTVGV